MTIKIIIDRNIPEYDKFISGLKSDLEIIEFTCTNINASRVGFVWENSMKLMPFGETSYMGSRWFTQEFVNFIEMNPNIKIDLITCNLSSVDFIEELNRIRLLYPNVTIEYSLDQTGFIPGNWILESSGIDIKGIYFTEKIDNWRHTLLYLPFNPIFNKKPIKFNTPATIKSIANSGYTGAEISNVVNVFSTNNAFAGLKSDGSVVTWGDINYGGNYTGVHLNSNVVNIFSNYCAFAALKSDGSVVTWGDINYGGNFSVVTYDANWNLIYTSIASNLSSGVVNIFSNYGAFAALKSDGSVVTWGFGYNGGNSSGVYLNSNVVNVFSTCYAFAALKSDGSVVTWGDINSGGNYTGVYLNSNVVNVFSTGSAFAALKSDGSVVTWGDINNGGNSSGVYLNSNVVNIFSNYCAFAALKSDGSVVTWGSAYSGGNSSGVYLNSNVVNIFSTENAFAALKSDGSVVTWGSEYYGGNSSGVYLNSNVVNIFSNSGMMGNDAFAALKSDGSVVTWGWNVTQPVLSSGVVNIFSRYSGFAALKEDGSVVAFNTSFGSNSSSSTGLSITYAYGSSYNFVYVSSPHPIPRTPTFLSKSQGRLNFLQRDFTTSNITSYEYKIDVIKSYEYKKISENNYEIDISLGWNIVNSNNIITDLSGTKSYFLKLRARNSTAPSDYNSFLVESNSNGQILLAAYITETVPASAPVAISAICFPAGTLIDTDQGKICIELIDKNVNTIRGMKIVGITETVS